MNDAAREPPEPRSPAASDVRSEVDDELATLRARVTDLTDQRLRALANLDNARKRCDRDLRRAREQERAAVAAQWLPVLDNLERALAHAGADPASIIDGLRAVTDQAVELVARLGFPRQDDLGAPFNPTRHDAVGSRADAEAEDGTVIEVLQHAYGEGEHQLRPALVVVAKGD